MSHIEFQKLVSNLHDLSPIEDYNLCDPSGIVIDNQKKIWVPNRGNHLIDRNVTQYDQRGHSPKNKLSLIDHQSMVIPSQQRQLISDLLWLQKNVLFYVHSKIFMMPKICGTAPILGDPLEQPSKEELSLSQFLNGDTGYLKSSNSNKIEINELIRFCINHPMPLTLPNEQKVTQILSDAHHLIYKKLLFDLNNQSLINQYGTALLEAQSWLRINGPYATSIPSLDVLKLGTLEAISMINNRFNIEQSLPIGLIYNQTKGFVGCQLDNHMVSSELIMATPQGIIYTYNSLINTGLYDGMITAVDNSSNYSVYTGLSIAGNNLYLTDLSNNRIDVYDYGWNNQRTLTQAFIDPDLPNGFSPYNVVTIGFELYVMYAYVNPYSVPGMVKILYGSGLGIINVFNYDGILLRRVMTHGHLNAPWGLMQVNNQFWVINHGDGQILIYDHQWRYRNRIRYPGLTGFCQCDDTIYFSSSSDNGQGGLISKLMISKLDSVKKYTE